MSRRLEHHISRKKTKDRRYKLSFYWPTKQTKTFSNSQKSSRKSKSAGLKFVENLMKDLQMQSAQKDPLKKILKSHRKTTLMKSLLVKNCRSTCCTFKILHHGCFPWLQRLRIFQHLNCKTPVNSFFWTSVDVMEDSTI